MEIHEEPPPSGLRLHIEDQFQIPEAILVQVLDCSPMSIELFSRSPNLLLHLIQLLLLSQALYLTYYLVIYREKGLEEWGYVSIPLAVLPVIITMIFFIPDVLPTYTLVRYVDNTSVVDVVETLRYVKNQLRNLYKKRVKEARRKIDREMPANEVQSKKQALKEAKKSIKADLGIRATRSRAAFKQWRKKQFAEDQQEHIIDMDIIASHGRYNPSENTQDELSQDAQDE